MDRAGEPDEKADPAAVAVAGSVAGFFLCAWGGFDQGLGTQRTAWRVPSALVMTPAMFPLASTALACEPMKPAGRKALRSVI